MTKINNVIDLLAKEELTSKEITERIGDITSDIVYVYLNKLFKGGIIERTTNKKPYKYKKSLTPIDLLKQLYEFMSNENKCKLKNLEKSDIDLLEMIKRMIK